MNFKGEPWMLGCMVQMKIVDVKPYSLRGEVVA
ncbi:MAG: TRAM domain-containing protein [Gammaproteobacteria bacterium]|nr:TRAM domain-containing protein [Gammaproteobacteria bacterium]